MGDKKKVPVVLTPEEKYEECKQLFNSMSCMTITEEKVQMYKTLAKDFKELGDLEEAGTYAKQCEKLAKETTVLVKDKKLEMVRKLITQAATIDDLRKADKLLIELKDYKDSDDLRKQWQVVFNKRNRKSKRGLYLFYATIVLIIGLVIFSRTDLCRYQIGKVLLHSGQYGYAINIFSNLEEYKDSQEYVKEGSYKAAEAILKKSNLTEDDYRNAKDYFLKTIGYKDTNQKIAEVEQRLIACREVGDKIKIGNCDWIIVEKQEGKALVVKKAGIEDLAYCITGEVNWENSDVRQYLNTTFLTENFLPEELAYIEETTISGEQETKDKLFILSAEEIEKYRNLFKEKKFKFTSNSWLRTAGTREGYQAFVSPDGTIMKEGYTADSTDLLTIPAFWYQY